MKKNEHYLIGVRSAYAYYYSSHYAGFDRNIRAEDAIKLFLPPLAEILMQISIPLPKPRKDWIKGFKKKQAVILAKMAEPS